MKHTLKKIIVIAWLSFFIIAILLNNTVNAAGVLADNNTYTPTMQDIQIDGTNIKATTFVPQGKTTPMGLVVMCHGYFGQRKGDGNSFVTLGNILATNGIAAITLDFPAMGERKEVESLDQYTLSNMNSDISKVIDYMQANYNIASGEIGFCGHSMGGRVASLNLGRAKVAALWAPANGEGVESYRFLDRMTSDGLSPNFKPEMEQSRPNDAIRSFSGPLLLAYGNEDQSDDSLLGKQTCQSAINAFNSSASSKKVALLDLIDNHNFDKTRETTVIPETADLFCNYFVGHDAYANVGKNVKRYTVEDIIFNKIPVLDVNIFSDVAGGEPIVEGSVTDVIRTIVATWYVSVRNAIAVVLFILLVYSGMRMSIATVASDKANYKVFFIGWLKSIIILFTIHLIIAFILNINDMLVNMFNNLNSNEYQMYDTIRTRAYDLRLSVGLAGTIMYIFIIFLFIKFLWMYIKRLFTTLILIILAPFIAGKYAFDSASGKKSRAFSSWLYQFSTNVVIQSAHALLYTSLVSIALDISLNNITSFIIALVFLNFMLGADKIVLKLFKFSDNIDDMHKPFKKEEQLAGYFYAYGVVKTTGKLGIRGARFVGNLGKNAVEAVGNITGRDYIGEVKDNVNEKLDSADEFLVKQIDKLVINNNNNNSLKQKMAENIQNYLILKINARQKGVAGRKARQTLKLKKAKRHETFSSNFKFILGEVQGFGSLVIGIPVMIFSPEAGIGTITAGVKSLKTNRKQEKFRKWSVPGKALDTLTLGAYGNRLEAYEKSQKTNKEIGNLVNAVNKTHKIRQAITTEYGKIPSAEEREKAREAMKKVNKLRNETSNVRRYMQNYMKANEFNSLEDMDDDQKRKMIIDISNRTGAKDVMTREEIDKVGMFVVDTITGKKGNAKYTDLNIDNMSTLISETLTKSSMKSEFVSLGLQINKLKDSDKELIEAEYQATEEDDNESIDIDRFIDNLEY